MSPFFAFLETPPVLSMNIIDLNPADGIEQARLDGRNGRSPHPFLDAGINPKLEGLAAMPMYDRVKDLEVDAIALTHRHRDPCGSFLWAWYFPAAHVLMTELSYFRSSAYCTMVNVMKTAA